MIRHSSHLAVLVPCSGAVSFGVCKVQLLCVCVWFAEEAADLIWGLWSWIWGFANPEWAIPCCSVGCRGLAAKSLRKGEKILVQKRFINCRKTRLLILSNFLAVLKGDEVNARIWFVTFIPSDKILCLYLVMCYLHIKRKLQAFFTLVVCLSNQMQETVSCIHFIATPHLSEQLPVWWPWK